MYARTLGFTAALAVTALSPIAAMAQTTPDVAADRADAAASRNLEFGGLAVEPILPQMALIAESEKKLAYKFSTAFSAPLAYSTNPERVSSNARGDGHATPAVGAKFEVVNTRGGVFNVSVGGNMDLNFDRPANDTSTLVAGLGYGQRIGTAKDNTGLTTSASYGFADIYQKQFGSHIVSTHTGAVGLSYKTPKDPTLSNDEYRLLTKFTWGLEAGRREASVSVASQNRFKASAGFEGAIVLEGGKALGWGVSQTVLYKGYTGGAAKSRDDFAFMTTGALSYPLINQATLILTAQYERNVSDATGKDYDVWEIGPQLRWAY